MLSDMRHWPTHGTARRVLPNLGLRAGSPALQGLTSLEFQAVMGAWELGSAAGADRPILPPSPSTLSWPCSDVIRPGCDSEGLPGLCFIIWVSACRACISRGNGDLTLAGSVPRAPNLGLRAGSPALQGLTSLEFQAVMGAWGLGSAAGADRPILPPSPSTLSWPCSDVIRPGCDSEGYRVSVL